MESVLWEAIPERPQTSQSKVTSGTQTYRLSIFELVHIPTPCYNVQIPPPLKGGGVGGLKKCTMCISKGIGPHRNAQKGGFR